MKNNTSKAYLLYIGSMLIFGTIGVFRRFIPLSSAMLAFSRGIIGAGTLCCFVRARGGRVFHGIGRRKILLLMLTGALIGINWILLFEAYNYTTIATATLCYYMQPTIVILCSPLVFRERLTAKKLCCALLGIVGMVFVSGLPEGGGIGAGDAKGILLGLGAAAFYASVVLINKLITVEDAYEKTILQLLAAAGVMVPYLLLQGGTGLGSLNTAGVIMLLLVGVVHTGMAYAMYFGAMQKLEAQSVALLSYIDPVFALLLSALVLREGITVYGCIGAVLIIGAAVLSELGGKEERTTA